MHEISEWGLIDTHKTRFSAAINTGKFKYILGQLIAVGAPTAQLAKKFIHSRNPPLPPAVAGSWIYDSSLIHPGRINKTSA